jgi:photosystem II stability/assembly factor-like uncharacterized protein
MKNILRSLLLVLIGFHSVNAQWRWVHPTPQGNNLHCIVFPDSQTGYAGGDKGTILKSTNSGAGWSQIYTNRFEPITGLYFISPNEGLAAQQQYLQHTSDGGTTWNTRYRFADLNLDKVNFISPDTGWITGEFLGSWHLRYTADSGSTFQNQFTSGDKITAFYFLNGGNGWMSFATGQLEKTTDYGQTWQNLGSTNGTGFNGIQFMDSLTGFACADNGEIFNTTDGGLNWTSLNNPASGSGIKYSALQFTSATNGFVSGSDGFLVVTTDGGQTWTVNAQAGWFSGFAFAQTGNALYLAGNDGEILGSTDNGVTWTSRTSKITEGVSLNGITHTTSGYYTCGDFGTLLGGNGSAWSLLNSNTSNSLYGIAFSTVTNGVVVGEAGTIIRTTNAGLTWTVIAPITANNLRSADNNGATLYACGDNETLLKSTNAGQTWISQSTPLSGTGYNYMEVQFPSQDTGFIFTDQNDLLSTTNGALTWTVQSFSAQGAITGAHFVNGLTGWVCTSANEIFGTNDGGVNWNFLFQYAQPVLLKGILFQDSQKGYAFGEGVMLQTSDGGQFWSEEFYPSQKQINAADISGTEMITAGAGRASLLQRYENCAFNVPAVNLCMDNNYNGTLTYSGPAAGRSGVIQLSDEFGDFFNPLAIGTIQPGQSSVSFLVPSGVNTSTGYRLRAFFNNPPLISEISGPKSILQSPSVQMQASGPTLFCPGDSVILFITGNPGWSYQWFRDSVAIPGATGELLTVFTTGNYTIQVYDSQCGYTSQPIDVLVSCTGITERMKKSIKAFPNPATSDLTITWPREMTVQSIRLTEITGRVLASYPTNGSNQLKFSLEGLAPGMYLVAAEGGGNYSLRIVKN